MAVPSDDQIRANQADVGQGDSMKIIPSSAGDLKDKIIGLYHQHKTPVIIALVIIFVLVIMGGTMLFSGSNVTAGAVSLAGGVLGIFVLYWYAAHRTTSGSGDYY